eukprot:1161850-Pelagomonas_calceolata.AAC.2
MAGGVRKPHKRGPSFNASCTWDKASLRVPGSWPSLESQSAGCDASLFLFTNVWDKARLVPMNGIQGSWRNWHAVLAAHMEMEMIC